MFIFESRAAAILFKKEREGFEFILSILEIAAWEVLIFLARSRWESFLARRFSIICLAIKYSVSDSFHAF